jgi:acetolactate synthase-1/2/3 large subunit
MKDADAVLVIGRRLDYQLGYGSPAVFPNARFVRVADTAGELFDNRRGTPEILATPELALNAIVKAAGNRAPKLDRDWADALRKRQRERSQPRKAEPALGSDGKIHPNKIFEAIAKIADPDYIASPTAVIC